MVIENNFLKYWSIDWSVLGFIILLIFTFVTLMIPQQNFHSIFAT